MNTIKTPGFTAEATLHKRSECYHQKEADIAASRNGAGILPALRTRNVGPGRVRSLCTQGGGLFFPQNHGVFGCLFPDGSGVFCGGVRPGDANSCEAWGPD